MKLHKWLLIVAILFVILSGSAYAEGDATVLQTYITEQTITVILDTELSSDGLICLISARNASITDFGTLSDEGVLTRTTILLDISKSMPRSTRSVVIKTLECLVEQKATNEEYRLVVFGEEIIELHDFTSDRYNISTAIDQIEFNGMLSRIYDAIYRTIPIVTSYDSKTAFHRTIVITDGADETATGFTREELFIKLQNEHYPVDVIEVSENETGEDKDLSAISRMSGGRYFSLTGNTDPASLAQSLDVGSCYYFTAVIPDELLDGTTRQVDISDGVHSISIDIKLPVYNPSIEAAPEPIPANLATPVPATAPIPAEETPQQTPQQTKDPYAIAIIIGASTLIIITAVIVTITVLRSKKKVKKDSNDENILSGFDRDFDIEKTEIIRDCPDDKSLYTLKVSSSNDPSKIWTLAVIGELLIGRAEHCDIRLDDKSVSREQCKVITQEYGLSIVQIGTTNTTTVNGTVITDSSPLQSGDTIKIGRETLNVDYIQTLDTPQLNQGKKNRDNESTEMMFREQQIFSRTED